jgi:hypothetical protein
MTQSINKKILINQPYYLGDIIFVMAIAQKYVNDGYEVIFPVRDEYINLKKNFPTVNIILLSEFPEFEKYNNSNEIIEDDKYRALPLQKSHMRHLNEHMREKYACVGLPLEMWRNIQIVRDFETESKLFVEIGLKLDDKYNLINEFHRPFFQRTPIIVENEYKNIYMSKIDGYGLLDWIGVMEKSQSIYTVATSIIFLIDSIETMPNDIHIYRRYNENTGGYHDHLTYKYLLEKKYNYH